MDNVNSSVQILRKNVKKILEINNTVTEIMNEMLLIGSLEHWT